MQQRKLPGPTRLLGRKAHARGAARDIVGTVKLAAEEAADRAVTAVWVAANERVLVISVVIRPRESAVMGRRAQSSLCRSCG